MSNNMPNYLCINGQEFDRKTVITSGAAVDLLPSSVLPKTEIIKTTERSLSGKMCVDITNVKRSITVTFDVIDDDAFVFLRDFLAIEDVGKIDADGLCVNYFGLNANREKETAKCFVDSFTYTPFIVEDEIKWRNVTLELVEI